MAFFKLDSNIGYRVISLEINYIAIMKNQLSIFSIFFFLSSILLQSCTSKTNAEFVIEKMHTKYKDTWYPKLTFEQKAMFYVQDTINFEQTWFEALEVGKGLAIKFDSLNSGSGYIFKNDSMFVFNDNEVVNRAKRVHEILELGFNVYKQPVSITLQKLKKADLDFTFFQEDAQYYVIGNPEIKQVWIDKERLLFSIIETKNKNGTIPKIEFNKYKKLGEGWIAPEVIFYNDDKISLKEVYSNIQLPKKLPNNLLNTSNFESIQW